MNLGQILYDVEFRRADAHEDAPWLGPLHPDVPVAVAERTAIAIDHRGDASGLVIFAAVDWRWRKVPS